MRVIIFVGIILGVNGGGDGINLISYKLISMKVFQFLGGLFCRGNTYTYSFNFILLYKLYIHY